MKKNLFLVVAALLLFTACDKDGVYNPKQKVATVITQSTQNVTIAGQPPIETVDNPHTATWTWDKKLLKSINYEGGNLSFTFEYDGKQISQIKMLVYGDPYYYKYTYKDKKIDRVDLYKEDELIETIDYTYDGKKISTITVSDVHELTGKKAEMHQIALSFILPSTHFMDFERQDAKAGSGAKNSEPTVFHLSWDGDNLAKVVSNYEETVRTEQFTYDDNNNPYYNYYDLGEGVGYSGFSKNNVVKEIVSYERTNGAPIHREYNYKYEYDSKKFPTSVHETYEFTSGTGALSISTKIDNKTTLTYTK